ncbi:MAG: TonB-dependent receptor plug domain-containing protein [Prevotellaceae bacterium]|jgi:outer membrane cobalamin receptor|nr:TonB-dependent receptor plug domain-containing protein [Prevotellaceae bacterium]
MQFIFSPSKKTLLFSLPLFYCCLPLYAQETNRLDTTTIHNLHEIVITEQYRNSEIRATAPFRILSSKKIETLNAFQLSDAVKHLSGVTLKDYGGIGGMKTVSVRSLGAGHTAVAYDGIPLTDAQTGQIDLSRLSLENVDLLTLNSGQSDNIFQPARMFASASLLNIRTFSPLFDSDENINGRIGLKTGSFGMLNPSTRLNFRLSQKIRATFGGEYLTADGEYPYTLHYGQNDDDLTEKRVRQNTDVANLRLETTCYVDVSETEQAVLKAYYYRSERGLPDAAIFYRPESLSKKRVKDSSFFMQGNYRNSFDPKWQLLLNGKYNDGYFYYLNPHYRNQSGKEEYTYRQNEYYLSASTLYRAFQRISFSLSSDYALNNMRSDTPSFVNPRRHTLLTAIAGKFVSDYFLATAALLNTVTAEQVDSGQAAENHLRFSPTVGFSVKPFAGQDFRMRFFYKNIFRLPTFNDLYYPKVGNSRLKPETANQVNIGLNYALSWDGFIPFFSISADVYHNSVEDKIVAIASQELFAVSMINYGKVAVTGLDLTAEAKIDFGQKTVLALGANYTWQRALIKTDPTASDYLHQIPYTPRISGSGNAALETPWVNCSYAVVWSGHRYKLQNFAENRLPAYADHSLSLSKTVTINKIHIALSVEVLNLFDKNYEIILNYPMPGRSYRGTISLKF